MVNSQRDITVYSANLLTGITIHTLWPIVYGGLEKDDQHQTLY